MPSMKESLKKLKETLAPMTWKQRIDHLWTYYKVVAVVFVILCIVVSLVITGIQNKQIDHLYSGVLVNTPLTDEGMAVFTNDLLQRYGTGNGKEVIDLEQLYYGDDSIPDIAENNQDVLLRLTVLAGAQSVDVILCDEYFLNQFVVYSGYGDVRNILSEKQLAQLSEKLVWSKEISENESYPVAVDISDTEFVKNCVTKSNKVYLFFPHSSDNAERNVDFVDYILQWTK